MAEDHAITTTLLAALAPTPYACTALARLSGGTANFVYRGALRHALRDGSETVILKHAEEFLAGWSEFRLPADRCLIEASALAALQTLPASIQRVQPSDSDSNSNSNSDSDNDNLTIQITTPALHHFDRQTQTQIQKDLPAAVDLKTFLLSSSSSNTTTSTSISRSVESDSLSKPLAHAIGRALGEWLLSFHEWIEAPAQHALRTQMGRNSRMQQLKCSVNYDGLVDAVERFPAVLRSSRGVFERVRDMARAEVGREDGPGSGSGVGGIHGDFWSGNILLPATLHDQKNTAATIFVTDWELAQTGPRALDLGQMIAELYMAQLYKGVRAGAWIARAFVEAYRPALTDDVAFRAAVHAGVHLVAFGSMVAGWGDEQQVRDVVAVGRDLVVKGWERERGWFLGGASGSVLGCLFG